MLCIEPLSLGFMNLSKLQAARDNQGTGLAHPASHLGTRVLDHMLQKGSERNGFIPKTLRSYNRGPAECEAQDAL